MLNPSSTKLGVPGQPSDFIILKVGETVRNEYNFSLAGTGPSSEKQRRRLCDSKSRGVNKTS